MPTLDELALRCTFDEETYDLPLTYWSTAYGGEVGELLNKIKKISHPGKENPSRLEMEDEIADNFIYFILLCFKLNYGVLSIQRIINAKLNELEERRNADG